MGRREIPAPGSTVFVGLKPFIVSQSLKFNIVPDPVGVTETVGGLVGVNMSWITVVTPPMTVV